MVYLFFFLIYNCLLLTIDLSVRVSHAHIPCCGGALQLPQSTAAIQTSGEDVQVRGWWVIWGNGLQLLELRGRVSVLVQVRQLEGLEFFR